MRSYAQVGKFLLAGGIAAGMNFFSRFLFSWFMPYIAAITAAFIVGLVAGFFLMKLFVFSTGSQSVSTQAWYFLFINLAGLALTILVSIIMERIAHLVLPDPRSDEAIGHLFGVASPVLLSFFAHKRLTFR